MLTDTTHGNDNPQGLINGVDKPTTVTLDETTAEFIRDVAKESEQKQREAASLAAMPYLNQQQAALQLFIRREKLEGNWQLQDDGVTLRRES